MKAGDSKTAAEETSLSSDIAPLTHVGAQEPPTAATTSALSRVVPAAGPSYALRG
jgi:hypothetical protein